MNHWNLLANPILHLFAVILALFFYGTNKPNQDNQRIDQQLKDPLVKCVHLEPSPWTPEQLTLAQQQGRMSP